VEDIIKRRVCFVQSDLRRDTLVFYGYYQQRHATLKPMCFLNRRPTIFFASLLLLFIISHGQELYIALIENQLILYFRDGVNEGSIGIVHTAIAVNHVNCIRCQQRSRVFHC
jgi:hypothetical protein